MGGSFDSANYLRGLGWSGPGSSLNGSAHGRAKPVTVVQKKNLGGVGRDRDTSFAWWDAIFTSVATKVGGENKVETHRTTSTGILSHRPPPPKGNAYEPSSTSASSGSRLNLDAMASAKIEYARRQLYSGFLRGSTLKPGEEPTKEDKADGAGKKRKRDEEDAASSASSSSDDEADKKAKMGKSKRSKEEKAAKKARKEARRVRKEEKAAKKLAKAEKRAAKEAKRKGKGKAKEELVDADGDVVLVETVVDTIEVSTTTTPPAELDPSSLLSTSADVSKEERRAAKKLRKALAADSSTSSAPLALPSPSTPSEPAVALEEPVDEKAARRAEKERKRAEKAARKEKRKAEA
ncbi:hypothetical protein JCM8097_001095 [Rhodosporidiobolus ruineniae]